MLASPALLLLIIGLILLVADALGKLPSWPWGLVLFLLVLIGLR
jgi:hypothetical protein